MHTDEPRKNPLTDLGYETEDMNMRGLWTGAKWFFIFTFFAIFAGAGMYMLMNHTGIENSQQLQSPFLSKVPAAPNPLLQTNVTTKTDMLELRRAENNALTTPAYVDQEKGIIRIPVDHAIDLEVERLQAGPGSPAPTDIPVETPNPSTAPGTIEHNPATAPSPKPTVSPSKPGVTAHP